MTTLIMVRHGESEANRQNLFAGHADFDLTDIGRKQAEMTAAYIAENYHVDAVYASDLQRAFKTGTTYAQMTGKTLVPKPGMREIFAGEWEGVPFDELKQKHPVEFGRWCNDIGRAGCMGGETTKELSERILRTLTEIAQAHDGQTVAIFTHGTPLRVMQAICQLGDAEEANRIPWASNASVSVLEYENNQFSFKVVGYDAHLKELRTVLPPDV